MPTKDPDVSNSRTVFSDDRCSSISVLTESLENADPSVRVAIVGKRERVPVTAANDTIAQVEYLDVDVTRQD